MGPVGPRGFPGRDGLLQGLTAGCIYVGSSDPFRVLRLSHNKYARYPLKHLLLRICTTCRYRNYMLLYWLSRSR